MKNLLKVIFSCVILVVFVVIMTKTTFLQSVFSVMLSETQNSEENFAEFWYYNCLTQREQDIYLKIAMAVENHENKVVEIGDSVLSASQASRAYEAYLLDNPDRFYVSNKYEVSEAHVLSVTKIEIKLNYEWNKKEIENKKQALAKELDSIISKVITTDMTDFEKEVALHDYLVNNVSYYSYTDIDEMPSLMHNAYGALVQKEAVCDGISDAYCLLLRKCQIDNIVVTGKMGDRHAWNKVKLDGEWYNVDVTADACGKERVLSHIYFNLSDDSILNSHTINCDFDTPVCNGEKYNYYEYNDFKLTTKDFFSDKIQKIIKASTEDILEFRVDENIEVKDVIQELYNLNFNNYKTNGIREVKYFHIQNVLVISK